MLLPTQWKCNCGRVCSHVNVVTHAVEVQLWTREFPRKCCYPRSGRARHYPHCGRANVGEWHDNKLRATLGNGGSVGWEVHTPRFDPTLQSWGTKVSHMSCVRCQRLFSPLVVFGSGLFKDDPFKFQGVRFVWSSHFIVKGHKSSDGNLRTTKVLWSSHFSVKGHKSSDGNLITTKFYIVP